MTADRSCSLLFFTTEKVRVFVSESENSGRLYAYQGSFMGNVVLKQRNILTGKVPGFFQKTLGKKTSSRLVVIENLDAIPKLIEEPYCRNSNFSFIVVQ